MLGALERSRPLVGVAAASRELAAVDEAPDAAAGTVQLAPFNPTSDAGTAAAMDLLALGPGDTLLDVGCGDGRVLVEAARRCGCQCVGVETDAALVARAAARAEDAGVAAQVRVLHGDATTLDLAGLGATAVFLYLVPEGLAVVWPAVLALLRADGPCTRAVTYVFRAPDAEAAETTRLGPVACYKYV